jgi:hypothetical protein
MPTSFVAQNGRALQQQTGITVPGCSGKLKVHVHKVKGRKAKVTVSVPSAGSLVVSGGGLTTATRRVGRAAEVTVTLGLSRSGRALLREHPGRKLATHVTLHFTPAHGRARSASVGVMLG